MLTLTNDGRAMGGTEAVNFFEMLPDNIPDEIKDEEFCEEYEQALNRLRYLVTQAIPKEPIIHLGLKSSYHDYVTCPKCGQVLDSKCGRMPYCENCGQKLDWSRITEKRIQLHKAEGKIL